VEGVDPVSAEIFQDEVSSPASPVRRIDESTDESGPRARSVRTGRESSEEVSTMAATIDIEIESGVYTDPVRRHRGYYAGDFSSSSRQGEAS
jgi:hypothetical protein